MKQILVDLESLELLDIYSFDAKMIETIVDVLKNRKIKNCSKRG